MKVVSFVHLHLPRFLTFRSNSLLPAEESKTKTKCSLRFSRATRWSMRAVLLTLLRSATIGMKAGKPEAPLSGRTTLAIAAATVGVALSIMFLGDGDAGLVPLLLGLATAIATLAASLGAKVSVRAKLALLLTLAALIAFHSGGLVLAGLMIDGDAAPLVPNWALLTLLVVFLGTWSWQQQRVSIGIGLPLRLYVHLINAGALPAGGNGEKK